MASIPVRQHNYTGELIEECQRRGLKESFVEAPPTGPSHIPTFTCWVKINNETFPEAQGKSKKETKNLAAKNALEILKTRELKPPERLQNKNPESEVYFPEPDGRAGLEKQNKNPESEVYFPEPDGRTGLEKQNKNPESEVYFPEPDGRAGLEKTECSSPQRPLVTPSPPPQTPSTSTSQTVPVNGSFISLLNTYGQQNNLVFDIKYLSLSETPHLPTFSCSYRLGDRSFKEAVGNSKKNAKRLAAKYACEELNLKAHPSEELDSEELCSEDNVKSISDSSNPDSCDGGKNFIGKLNEYGQQNQVIPQFEEVERQGPSHDPQFVCRAILGDRKFKEAEGKTKKIAKQKAAQLALQELDRESENSQVFRKPEESQNNSAVKSRAREYFGSIEQDEDHTEPYTVDERFKNEFEEISELGSGGYGCVFKARQKINTKFYAVKKVKLEDNKNALKEVIALAELDHVNVVRYYHCWIGQDYFDDDLSGTGSNSRRILHKVLFIQMELCEKGTLKDWIDDRRGKESDKSESLPLFQQIVAGVEYIHSKKLIHRDLKPSNIFLPDDKKIKIGDFGLVTSNSEEQCRTRSIGTPTYMSPEQKAPSSKYGSEVDIFALGLIFFEIVWQYSTQSEKAKNWPDVRKGEFPQDFKKKYPKEKIILRKMLSTEPKQRPSASVILSLLKEEDITSSKTC